MKHCLFFLLVFWLVVLGSAILIADIMHGGTLHVISGGVGAGMLVAAVAFAIPLRFKVALETIAPYLPAVLKAKAGG